MPNAYLAEVGLQD